MENIKLNVEAEQDYSSGEENEYDLIETEAVEVNQIENKDNDYLLVGVFGNGSAFLKSSLYTNMKESPGAYKVKFMTRLRKDKTKAKKVSVEIYQFSVENVNHLVLHTKQNLTDQSYKYVLDYLKNNGINYKRVAIFDSCHSSSIISLDELHDRIFCLKNTWQSRSNQLIRVKDLPSPNTFQDFSAYLLTYHEVIDVPSVAYLAVSSEYEVSLDSIRLFNETTVSYAFLRDKLSESFFSQNQIKISSILSFFREFNSFKNHVYS